MPIAARGNGIGFQSHNKQDPRAEVLSLLTLQPCDTVPHIVVTPNHKIISLLLHNYNLAIDMDCNVNIRSAGYLVCDPCEGGIQPPAPALGLQRTGWETPS